jgi:hypothetical protein
MLLHRPTLSSSSALCLACGGSTGGASPLPPPHTCRSNHRVELSENLGAVYSCRRRGERAKLSPPPAEETESDYRREFRKSSWAACIKRIYEIDPLKCPKCKAQMRIIAFIQDAHSIKDIMKAQGIPDFQAPPPIPKFIDTVDAIDELPSYDSLEPAPDDY